MTTDDNADYLTFKQILGKCFKYRGSSRQRYLSELEDFIRARTERCVEARENAKRFKTLEKRCEVQRTCNNALSSRIDKLLTENKCLTDVKDILLAEHKILKLKLREFEQQSSV